MKKDISLIDLLSIVVSIMSFISVLLLVINRFDSIVALLFTITLTVILTRFYNIKIKLDYMCIFLVLLALLPRIHPYNYVVGGQDEGLYVNISKYIQQHGTIKVTDDVWNIFKSFGHDDLYSKYNVEFKENRIKNVNEGEYLPGIYIKNAAKAQYTLQFYHLHPLWMALFGDLFGDTNRVFSLVFFAVLGIIYMYCSVMEITSSRLYAILVGALLALNPLHAFFSKFPVTEVMALSFSTGSLYYLIKIYKSEDNRLLYMFLAAFMMFGMFFTRISGFMYLPFILMLLLFRNVKGFKYYVGYILLTFLFFILSYYYGIKYTEPYCIDIYYVVTKLILSVKFYLLIPVFMFLIILILKQIKYDGKLYKLASAINRYWWLYFLVVLVLGLYKMYLIAYTNHYVGDKWFDITWNIIGHPKIVLLTSSMLVAVQYITPPLMLLLVIGLIRYKGKNSFMNLSLFFLLFFWVYFAIIKNVVPYQYYYSRYLLSELVPYTIMAAVILIYDARNKYLKFLSMLLIICAFLYSGNLMRYQFLGVEADGAYNSIKQISDRVDDNDLIVLEGDVNLSLGPMKTALVYYFGKNVVTLPSLSYLPKEIALKYGDIYYLSKDTFIGNGYNLIDELSYRVGHYEQSIRMPKQFDYEELKLKLYQVAKYQLYEMDKNIYPAIINYNTSGLYNDKIWTDGNMTIKDLNINVKNKKYATLKIRGYIPENIHFNYNSIKLSINDVDAKILNQTKNTFTFVIPSGVNTVNAIGLQSDVFVPKDFGINDDTRILGLDVEEIIFTTNYANTP